MTTAVPTSTATGAPATMGGAVPPTPAAAAAAAAVAAHAAANAAAAAAAGAAAATTAANTAYTTHQPGQLIDVGLLPAEQGVAKLIDTAVKMGASDLFFAANEQHTGVLVRHLGIVRPLAILSSEMGRRCQSHIKANSAMDLTERRRPLDGRWIYRPTEPGADPVDLRINVIPTLYGEDYAIRLLARGTRLFAMENLGMARDQFSAYSQMIHTPSGLILITGPTGSGKTATLYSSLIRLNDGKRKINTIEDPIEYAIDGLRQSQVNPQIDLGFKDLLRSVLRQSPDVIMIGEIRDEETAKTAVHAANSGMLVFATLHAPSAPGAIQSMRSLGVNSHFLATSLRGVVAQRLVRTLCLHCKQGIDLSDAPHTFDDVRPWLSPDEGRMLYAPVGCEMCNMSGYADRSGLFEVMPVTRSLRNLIGENAPVRTIRQKATEERMAEFRQTALVKVARGETSTEEVFRVIPGEHLTLDD
jgi:type II secretory ATPase GspE/PulE/Tfp pilus assembly ATPase PilB-like protein